MAFLGELRLLQGVVGALEIGAGVLPVGIQEEIASKIVSALEVQLGEAPRLQTGERPISDGENGLRVVRVLEAGQRSIQEGGGVIDL